MMTLEPHLQEIRLVDLRPQYEEIHQTIHQAIQIVLHSQSFIQGSQCVLFEDMWAGWLATAPGFHHPVADITCATVANGTAALELALRAHGIGPGHLVVLPALSFAATLEAVLNVGAHPEFVDVDARGLMDMDQAVAACGTEQVDAVVPVHLYGQAFDTPVFKERIDDSVPIIEDAAQAHGATYPSSEGKRKVGCAGTATWSFFPGKNLGAYGDAGAVTSPDEGVIAHVRLYRNHGGKNEHVLCGGNYRMDEIQAAVLQAKLPYLEYWNRRRDVAANYYRSGLNSLGIGVLDPVLTDTPHVFPVLTSPGDRDAVVSHMRENGIGVGIHYPYILPDLRYVDSTTALFPMAQHFAKNGLSLPLYPEIQEDQLDRVLDVLNGAENETAPDSIR